MVSQRPGLISPWRLIAPMLVIIVGVVGYPVLLTVYLAFTDARLLGGPGTAHWIGVDNFAYALTDPDFLTATAHTRPCSDCSSRCC
jgi:multiple sugar transport system permease protein